MHRKVDVAARKLKNTIESLQTQIELLQHENKGLEEAIKLEKRKKQRKKALKTYLLDIEDPSAAQVFSPNKIAQARLRKAEIEVTEQEKKQQKEIQKKKDKKRLKLKKNMP